MARDVFFHDRDQDVVITRSFDDQLKQIRTFISWHDQLVKHESVPTMLTFLSWLILYLSIRNTLDKCVRLDRNKQLVPTNESNLIKLLDLLNGYPSVINGTHSHIKGTYSDKLLEFIYYEETKEENFKDYYIAQSNVRNILRDMNGLLDPALSEGNDSGDNQNEKIKQYLASQECEFALTLLSSFKEKTKVTNLFNERVRSAIQDLNLRINPQPLPPKVVEGEDGVITIDD